MPETASSATLRQSLIARGFIVLEGREHDFVTLESMLFSAHHPQGDLQLLIFKRILEATWNLQRCREAEIALWQSTGNNALDPLLDDVNEPRYARIQKYARMNQTNLRRATEDLRAIQRRDNEALKNAERRATEALIPTAGHNNADLAKFRPKQPPPVSPRSTGPAIPPPQQTPVNPGQPQQDRHPSGTPGAV